MVRVPEIGTPFRGSVKHLTLNLNNQVASPADQGVAYACHCLNVRIRTGSTDQTPPEAVSDPSYTQVFVGDNITIKHPQLTLRSRQRVAEIPGTNRCVRSITLKCMVCQESAYRILQEVPVDFEGEDGLILPTVDYVEEGVLKSPHGWIQVHNSLLTGDAIAQAEAETGFSSTFSVVVPPVAIPPTPAVRVAPQQSSDSTLPPPPPPPPTYFDHVKPVLHHPPYTPSHPAFLHLAKLARAESQARRTAAENHVTEIIRQKTAEIESGDAAIRKQVEALWRTYKESVKEAQGEAPTPRAIGRSSSRSRERRSGRGRSASPAPAHGTPVSVRDFVPVSVPARRTFSPSTRPSALSASLVTSGFHHPRAQQEDTSSGAKTPDSETETTTQSEATLVQPPPSEVISILQFRRNVNETMNTEQSYRYFRNLEEDMARAKKQREETEASVRAANQQLIDTPERVAPGGPAVSTVAAIKQTLDEIQEVPSQAKGTSESGPSDPTTERGREKKGKRKVTFDVEPDIVAINQDAQPEPEDDAKDAEQETEDHREEMLFDMEEHEDDDKKAPQPAPALPFLEQAPKPKAARVGKRSQVMPDELASLRPASLPPASHMRPINRPPGVDSPSLARDMMQSLPPYSNPLSHRPPRSNGHKSPLSSANGNTVGQFSSDGKTWQSFTRGHPVSPTSIPEESENETTETSEEGDKSKQPISAQLKARKKYDADKYEQYLAATHNLGGIPGSMPIQIHFKTNARQPLSLASYQPQSALAQQQQDADALPTLLPLNGHGKTSSTTIRKALYAERDRVRSVDPGIMDFTSSDDEDGTDDTEESSEDEAEKARMEAYLATSRGRKRALKILQARSELPDSGMWRSLAN
ncbi:hypothetical protein BKA70DRAFT_1383042 [Coprinopsis sp. MPI-PUGE-AT-0042]|nr:hypothetical protein BKA70DRAFT_1383042 [Coprinopsis sp. MPI-PUGE-AT-0042]